jgi:hypothetical protein
MRVSQALGGAFVPYCALAMLAGCSVGASQVAPPALAQPGAANQPVVQQGSQSFELNWTKGSKIKRRLQHAYF